MAYIINRFNGTQLVAVEDGTVDQTTDLKLVGKNYSGYGEAQNENFLHLLESFAGTSSPTKALSGQVWYDSGTNKLKFFTGTTWKNAGGAEVNATEPSGLNEGDLWYSTTSNQLFAKTGTGEFILVGPQAAGDGTTQMLSTTVLDAGSAEKNVIIALVNDNPLYIISGSEFTLNVTQPTGVPDLTGFSLVKKGITLLNTGISGVTTDAGDTGEPVIWGTASDALKLGGIAAGEFLTSSSGSFTDVVTFATDAGFRVGLSNDLHVKIVSGTVGQITNEVGDEIRFGAKLSSAGSADVLFSLINQSTTKGIIPYVTDAYTLGSASKVWSNVYATTFTGTATKASTLDVSGTGRSATTLATANTIAARDSSGNLTATVFNGTATKARYADLAEKYTTGEELAPGTAVSVCSHPDYEVEPATASHFCIGVVSTDPAIMMNSEADGQYIALKGRVPVRVKGPVKKGQPVYAMADGVSTTIATTALVGVALESNDSDDEKLVECVLKV